MATRQLAPSQTNLINQEDEYEILEKIGQGSFGVIRKVRRKDDGQVLARKEISYAKMSQREREQLHAELSILQRLSQHPNIVSYLSRSHEKSSHELHLYMEYCGNGDLGGYIRRLKDKNTWATEDFVWDVVAGVVSALWRCHYGEDPPRPGDEANARPGKTDGLVSKKGHQVILHRDLKPENVFLGANNTTKLGDFGLSKIIASHDFASTYVGTPFYMSPEICAAERYSTYSDIWSFGCIIYELCAREPPFNARSHHDLAMKIRAGKFKPLHGVGGVDGGQRYSKELQEVVSWCLRVNPRERPDAQQLLNMPKVREARVRQDGALQIQRAEKERDVALLKLEKAQKQIEQLTLEVKRLNNKDKELEMAWHAKATLAIDQRVSETVERQKRELLMQFEQAVEARAEEKLSQHLASLPSSHIDGSSSDSAHIRSATPPGHRSAGVTADMMSFTTTGTTATTRPSSSGSILNDTSLHTDLTSLSLEDSNLAAGIDDTEEETSPLAQRVKATVPSKKPGRTPFSRAKTFATATIAPSPMDIQMVDPSPMAPMSVKGLGLSPRRQAAERVTSGLSGRPLRRNVFDTAAYLPPPTENEASGNANGSIFCDELGDEDDALDADVEPESPSRPASGMSNHQGDPFKALGKDASKLQKRARPSLGRAKTTAQILPQRPPRANIFAQANRPNDENRPPPSKASGVPVLSTSPTRKATHPNGKALTPSRTAPPPPAHAKNAGMLPKAATSSNLLRGRTLVELNQARAGSALSNHGSESGSDIEKGVIFASKPTLLPMSPAKWCPEKDGEEMPSPFLAKGRKMVAGVR